VLGEYKTENNLVVISMKFINRLKDIIPQPLPSNRLQISKALLLVSRLTVPECRISSTARQRNYNCYKKLQITQMKYRTDRSGGAFGNINSRTIDKLRTIVCSGDVINSIPKNKYGSIIVPYYANKNSKLVTKLKTYYMSVIDYNKVCHHPKYAPPTVGWQCTSEKFYKKLEEQCLINKSFNQNFITNQVYSKVMELLQFSPYNAALILDQLNADFDLKIDPTSYTNTLEKLFMFFTYQIPYNHGLLKKNGRFTVVKESAGGHADNYFGSAQVKDDEIFLESKITCCDGVAECRPNLKEDHNFINHSVPIGALAYPLYGIYSNCSPLMDIEVHGLHKIIHIGKKKPQLFFQSIYNTKICRSRVHS
jgi:hypothetical protein